MTCERQIDPIGDPRKEVRLVNEKNRRRMIVDRAHRLRQVVSAMTPARVRGARPQGAKADQPERASVLGQSNRLILEQWNARRGKRSADTERVVRRVRRNGRRPPVMV